MTPAGIVVAPEAEAVEAAAEILVNRGNAMDAAVAAAFVQGVTNPMMCGIGGFGTLLYWHRGAPQPTVLDFSSYAGRAVHPDQWADRYIGPTSDRFGYRVRGDLNDIGYGAIGVPTAVAGLGTAHARWGSLAWGRILEPAIDLASDGFVVTQSSVDFAQQQRGGERPDGLSRLRATPASAAIHAPRGRLLVPGERLVQSDLAAVLRRLAREGWREFYEGETGHLIAVDLAANGATVTRGDLAEVTTDDVLPLRSEYRGRVVFGAPPPAGGIMVAQMLAFLDLVDLGSHPPLAAERLRWLAESMKLARATRIRQGADPRFASVRTEAALDPDLLERAASIVSAGGRLPAGDPSPEEASTTHVVVVDGAGSVVSLTHSLGYSSGVVTPGLGFLYNNYLNCFHPLPGRPDSLEPGKHRESSTAPTVVADDHPRIALGAPGATRIATAVVQVVSNMLDHGMHPVEAVAWPRIDCQSGPIHLENRIPRQSEHTLQAMGYQTIRHPANYDRYFARPQLAALDQGRWTGASDPRGDGGSALTVPVSAAP